MKKTAERSEPDKAVEETVRKRNVPVTILKVIAVITIILAILFSVSTLKTVTVEDNALYNQQTIADAILNDNYSWNTIYVYVKYLFTEPDRLPFVESLDIRLTGLHSLSVRVNEKDMAGYLYVSGADRNAYFDKDGNVLELSTKVVSGVTKITGIDCTDAAVGSLLSMNISTRKEMLNLLQALKRKDLTPDEVQYGEVNSPIVILGNVRIYMGDLDQLNQKVERLAAIYPDVENLSGILHLEDWSETSASIIFSKDETDAGTGSEAADGESAGDTAESAGDTAEGGDAEDDNAEGADAANDNAEGDNADGDGAE